MRSQFTLWQNAGRCLGLLVLLAGVSACTITQSTFAMTANNAGSAFAAAATTLTYAHDGNITSAYAASSFVSFQSELSGTDQTLTAQGAADRRTLHHLLALYTPAMQVIDAPCLSRTCHWRKQIALLDRASSAFLEAGNS
jgi:hypothetical protein